MKNDKETIKQDINFLEKPLWHPKERNKNTIFEMKDEHGYKYESVKGIPSKVDIMILYYLLLVSQQNRYECRIETSLYKIMKGCDMPTTKEKKDRIIDSLARWKRVNISFSGVFFDGIKYDKAEFSIINDYWVDDNKRYVIINFNENWIKTIKESNFFKYISFNEMKHLRSPVAIRLYEILSKSFYKRKEWKIGVIKLKDKIPLQEKHYSTIKRKIESAVNTINRKTDMNIEMSVEKKHRNDGIITFRKVEKSLYDLMKENSNNVKGIPERENTSYNNFISNFSEEKLVSLQEYVYETIIQHNNFLLNKWKKDGFENKTIQNTFISVVKSLEKEKE